MPALFIRKLHLNLIVFIIAYMDEKRRRTTWQCEDTRQNKRQVLDKIEAQHLIARHPVQRTLFFACYHVALLTPCTEHKQENTVHLASINIVNRTQRQISDGEAGLLFDFAPGRIQRVFVSFNVPPDPIILVRENATMRSTFHQQNIITVQHETQCAWDDQPAMSDRICPLPLCAHDVPLFPSQTELHNSSAIAIVGQPASCYSKYQIGRTSKVIMMRFAEASSTRTNAPVPDLRIVPVEAVHPHETHDDQRSGPLIETLRTALTIVNPPVVAPLDNDQYVILDGANRCHTFRHLGYPHILVQIVSYESDYVELSTWQHVVSHWDKTALLSHLHALKGVEVHDGRDAKGVAHFLFPDGDIAAIRAPVETTHERNAVLQEVVAVYQQRAVLERSAISEPDDLWPLFPAAVAIVMFPHYEPKDIIAAVRYKAYLPPGISRHVVHGRALRVNYPMAALRDQQTRLDEKNDHLTQWVQARIAERKVRYYAEATYQFDE